MSILSLRLSYCTDDYNYQSAASFFLLLVTVALCSFLQWYVLQHLPFVDCLPYKKGNNIIQQMKMPEGATNDSVSIEFVYQKNGQQFEFDQEHFPADFDSLILRGVLSGRERGKCCRRRPRARRVRFARREVAVGRRAPGCSCSARSARPNAAHRRG